MKACRDTDAILWELKNEHNLIFYPGIDIKVEDFSEIDSEKIKEDD